MFKIQISLLTLLLGEYNRSVASTSSKEYLEVAGELFRKPAMVIQLAMQEHSRRTEDDTQRVLPENQQTLSDALEDIVDTLSSSQALSPRRQGATTGSE